MNKQDWIEYFEAINGRKPSPEEEAQALAAGEFMAETVAPEVSSQPQMPQQAPVQPVAQPQAAPVEPQVQANPQFAQDAQGQAFQQANANPQFAQNAQAQNFQQAQAGQFEQAQAGQFAQGQQFYQQAPGGQFQMPVAPKQSNQVGEAFKNFFTWFLNGFKNPQAKSEDSHLVFGLITVGLASWFMGWGVVNFIHRILMSIANISIDGETLKSAEPDAYVNFKQLVSSNFGIVKTILFILVFFVFYVIVMGAPVLFNKDKTKSFFTKLGQYFSYAPILFVLNFLAFLVTFIVPSSLATGKSSEIYDLFDTSSTNFLASLSVIGEKIPAFKAILTSGRIFSVLLIIGLVFIFVAFIKNIDLTLGKVNRFYISVALAVVFVIVLALLEKSVLGMIASGFKSLVSGLDSLF